MEHASTCSKRTKTQGPSINVQVENGAACLFVHVGEQRLRVQERQQNLRHGTNSDPLANKNGMTQEFDLKYN